MRRYLLCRVGLHRWRWIDEWSPWGYRIGDECYCTRCGINREEHR